MLDKAIQLLPSAFLIVVVALSYGNPPLQAAGPMAVAAFLWGFTFYVTRPLPPRDDEKIAQLESRIDDLAKQLDSVRSAVSMRQLR